MGEKAYKSLFFGYTALAKQKKNPKLAFLCCIIWNSSLYVNWSVTKLLTMKVKALDTLSVSELIKGMRVIQSAL